MENPRILIEPLSVVQADGLPADASDRRITARTSRDWTEEVSRVSREVAKPRRKSAGAATGSGQVRFLKHRVTEGTEQGGDCFS